MAAGRSQLRTAALRKNGHRNELQYVTHVGPTLVHLLVHDLLNISEALAILLCSLLSSADRRSAS